MIPFSHQQNNGDGVGARGMKWSIGTFCFFSSFREVLGSHRMNS